MFYTTGVDKIRQHIAKIWDAVKFRNTLIKKNKSINILQKDKQFIIKVEPNKSNLNEL